MKANIELFKFTVSDITLFHKPTSCEEAVTCIVSCFRWWLAVGRIFDGLDLVSKEIIENNFNDKKEIKANI